MRLKRGKTIFDRIRKETKKSFSYDAVRTADNPIRPFVDYYRRFAQKNNQDRKWWMGEEFQFWGNLPKEAKRRLVVEAYALFPEVLGNGQDRYKRYASWLITNNAIVDPNIRDTFSAGGTVYLNVGGKRFYGMPRVFKNLQECAGEVAEYIKSTSPKDLSEYWRKKVSGRTRLRVWIKLAEKYAMEISPSTKFRLGKMLREVI
jgi:hypothetical protein